MAKLENLTRGAAVKEILPDRLVAVDGAWYGSAAVKLISEHPAGKPCVVLFYPDRGPTVEAAEVGRLWSFDVDGELFRLVSEAHMTVQLNANSRVVKSVAATAEIEKDSAPQTITITDRGAGGEAGTWTSTAGAVPKGKGGRPGRDTATDVVKPRARVLRRLHGSAKSDATPLTRDVDLIGSSGVPHLVGLLDATVTTTVEIKTEIPSGAPDNVARTVTENCRTLKFESPGFEERW